MKGLLRKDFYVITKQLKLFLVIIPVITLTAGLYVSPFVLLLGASLPMTVIAYDERSKWNELSIMLPYSKKQLVVSKYLFGYICTFVALILAAAGHAIAAAMGMGLRFGGSCLVLFFSTAFALLYIPLSLPIFLRFGTTKGRLFFITFFALMGAFGPILQKLDSCMLQNLFQRLGSVVLPSSILLVVVNLISIAISTRLEKYPR